MTARISNSLQTEVRAPAPPECKRARFGAMPRRWTISGTITLALLLPALGVAQTTTPSDSVARVTRVPVAPGRPDYRNLRFDEDWTGVVRTHAWGDIIKAMPVVPGGAVTLTLGGQMRWRGESVRAFTLRDLDDDNAQSRLLLSADLQAGRRRGQKKRRPFIGMPVAKPKAISNVSLKNYWISKTATLM